MKKLVYLIFSFVLLLFLYLFLPSGVLSQYPQCDAQGGECRPACLADEDPIGQLDCPSGGGPFGNFDCCIPSTECGSLGGDCKRFQYGVCPDGYEPNPIGGFAELGCSTGERCCIPLTTGCSSWNPVTGCQSGYTRCTSAQTICCVNTNDCPIYTPPSDGGASPTCDAKGQTGIDTAIGCIPFGDTDAFIGFILRWAIGIGGGIAFLLIIYAAFMIMSSRGNPDRLKAGQELLTSAIAGLIMLIFSIFILRVIGVNILGIFK